MVVHCGVGGGMGGEVNARSISGVESELVNGPPIGQHNFSSDLIGQKMLPAPLST